MYCEIIVAEDTELKTHSVWIMSLLRCRECPEMFDVGRSKADACKQGLKYWGELTVKTYAVLGLWAGISGVIVLHSEI